MVSELDKRLWNEVAVRFRERHAAWVAGQTTNADPEAQRSSAYDTAEVIRQAVDAALQANPDLRETYDAAYAAVKNNTYRPAGDLPAGPRFFFEQFLDKLTIMQDEGIDLDVRALPVFREYTLSNAEWYPRLSTFLQFLSERREPFVAFVKDCLALREGTGSDARTRRTYLQRRNALFRMRFNSDVDQTSSSGFIVALESDIEHQEHDDRRMFMDCLAALIGRERFAGEMPVLMHAKIGALRTTAENLLQHIENVTTDTLALPERRTFVPLQPELIVFKPVEFDVRMRAHLARYRMDNPLMYVMLALIGCPVAWMVFKVLPKVGSWAVVTSWKLAPMLPLGPLSIVMQTKLGIPAADSRLLVAGLTLTSGIAAAVYLLRLPYTIAKVVHKKKVFAELRRRNDAEKRRVDALNAEAVQRVNALNEERRCEIEDHNQRIEARAPVIERIRNAYQDFARRKPGMVDELHALIGELNALQRFTESAMDPAAIAGAHVRLNACVSRMNITADRAAGLLRTLTDEMGVPAAAPVRPRPLERRADGERNT